MNKLLNTFIGVQLIVLILTVAYIIYPINLYGWIVRTYLVYVSINLIGWAFALYSIKSASNKSSKNK